MRPPPVLIAVMCVGAALAACRSNDSSSRDLHIDAGTVNIHARVLGEADAPSTVITVHGGPGLSLEAMSGFDLLADADTRVVGYDQRGSGGSTAPSDGDYSLQAQVADLEAVRVAVGANTVELIGESWGGAVVEAYAAAHPDRVTDMVLLGAMPLDRQEFAAGQQRFLQHVADLQRDGLIPKPLPSADDGSCVPTLEAMAPAYLADPRAHSEITVASCTAATATATFDAFVHDDAVERLGTQLGAYRGRALVLMGVADAFGLEWLDRNVALLAGATVEQRTVDEAGHLLMVDRPDAVFAMVDTFLAT